MRRVADTLYEILDQNTKEWLTYKKVSHFKDETAMTDAKADGDEYRKLGGEYFRKVETVSGLKRKVQERLNSVAALQSFVREGATEVRVVDKDRSIDHTFRHEATGTANNGTVYAAQGGGVWVMQFNGTLNVLWFGAKGDGVSDDTAALSNCYDVAALLGLQVNQHGQTLAVSSNVIVGSNTTLNGGRIKTIATLGGNVLTIQGANINLKGVEIDCNNINNYGINIISESANITLDQCKIQNLKEVAGNGIVTVGIRVEGGCKNVRVINKTRVENVVPLENGAIGDTAGAARAILFGEVEDCEVVDCDFINVQGLEDGDCIHVQSSQVNNEWSKSGVKVINCRFPSISKRAIKFQASGCEATGNFITSDTAESVCTFAGISTFGNDTVIENNTIQLNRATCAIELGGVQSFKSARVRGNTLSLNPSNTYSNTNSTSILSFIKLNATNGGIASDLEITRNTFKGHARALYATVNTVSRGLSFKHNVCEFSHVVAGGGNDLEDWDISDNTFIGNGALASSGGNDAVYLINVNGLKISRNIFKSTNGYKVRLAGTVGAKGVTIEESTIITPNNPSQYTITTAVTSGLDNIFSKTGQVRKIVEGAAIPTSGTWAAGDIVFNTAASTANPVLAWHCITGGTPGTWRKIINSDGDAERITIKGAAPTSGSLIALLRILNGDDKPRFILGKRSAETGTGNTGSNLALFAYSDDALTVTEVFAINRATGNFGLGISNPTERLDVNGSIKLTGVVKLGSVWIISGINSPENVLDAPIGSLFLRYDGGSANPFLYTKTTAAGSSTGWQSFMRATRAAAQADSTATDTAALVTDFNALLAKLRTAGIIAT